MFLATAMAAATSRHQLRKENLTFPTFFEVLNVFQLFLRCFAMCFACLPAKPVFIQALERQFFRGFGDFRRLRVRRYMAQTRPSERIRMHPIASERIRAGPNRSKHVPELPKTSEDSRKLQIFAKFFENFLAIVAFVPSFVLWTYLFVNR